MPQQPENDPKAERRRLIIKAYRKGATVAALAKRFNIERGSMARNLTRWGEKPPQDARRDRIIQAYHDGATTAQLAKRFRVTPGTMRTLLSRWGVALPEEEKRRRMAASGHQRKGAEYVWPDCPEHLQDDYATLRKYYSARDARAQLEAGA